MSKQITINSISSGVAPYDIWICDTCFGTCQYYDTTTTLPYTFILPEMYETYNTCCVKIIDDNGCVYCEDITKYKQFEDGLFFEFMDDIPYDFE